MNEAAAALEKALGEPESVKAVWKSQNTVMVHADKGATLQRQSERGRASSHFAGYVK